MQLKQSNWPPRTCVELCMEKYQNPKTDHYSTHDVSDTSTWVFEANIVNWGRKVLRMMPVNLHSFISSLAREYVLALDR